MAPKINPSKLLPQSKSSSLVKTERSSSLVVKEKKVNIASSIKPIELKHPELFKKTDGIQKTDFGEVHGKLIKVEKFLKSDFLLSKKESEKERKKKEKEDFDKAEKKLETKESNKFKLPGISGPSLGFLDRLKRFLFFTALGWLVPKIIEFLPKLEGFANLIGGVYKFAEGLFGGLFNGFMSLVKFGGDLKDKTLGFIAQATGGDAKNFEDKFQNLEKLFNDFVNISIVAGVLSTDIGLAAVDEINKQRNKGQKPEPGKPTKPGAKAEAKVTQGRGGQKPLGKPKVTGDVKPKPSWLDKLKGPFAKLKGPLSRFAGVAVPGLGAAVGAADAAARFKAGDKIGGTLASVSAALDAATVATALTGIGVPVAGILGGISMGIDVVLLIRDILSVIPIPFIPKNLLGFYRGGRIVRKYQSGGTAGARKLNTPVRRSISKTRRRPLIIQPPKTKPGKDVGGEDKIKEFYSKDSVDSTERPSGGWLSLFNAYTGKFEKKDKDSTRPYDALTKTSEILKEIPIVGGLMGASVDVALGQKPDKRVYQSLSAGIGYLIESLANQKANQSVTSLMRDLRGFAEGGYVPASRELKETYNPLSSGDLIAKVLGPTIDQRVNEAIQNIQKELQKKKEGILGTPDDKKDPGSLNDIEEYDYEVTGGEKPSGYPGRYLDHGYKGRDYQIEVGRAITVFAPGTVTYAQYNDGGFGRLVIVKHPNGQESYYAHLSKINVRVGDSIGENGTVIGLTGGDTKDPGAGRSEGPHLHFELRDSEGNRITQENSGDNFFRFGTVKSAKPRVGTLRPGEAGKPGQKFTIAQLVTLAKKAGFKGNNAAVAAAVAYAESTGNSKAHRPPSVFPHTDDSYGLWQINMIGDLGPDRRKKFGLKSNEDLWDPAVNANVAYKMSGGSNFSSWTSYEHGRHLPFLEEAQKALQKGDVVLPGAPKLPDLKPTIPEMGGQQIELNYGMKPGDEFTFTGLDGKQYKAHKTAKGFDFYTTGFFGLGSQKIDTTAGKNQQIVDAFIKERLKTLRGGSKPGKSTSSGKVSIYSGHADMTEKSTGGRGTPGGIDGLINSNFLSNEAYINDLVARRVAAKASGVAVYRSPIKTDGGRDPNSNWERAKKDVSSGIVPFEMHHDEPKGSAGLMMGKNYNSRLKKNNFIKSLHQAYGQHANTEEKGFFKYGGAILEISRLTPSILKNQKTINAHVEKESSKIANALTSTKMQSGGIVPSKPNLPIPNSFASYESYGSGTSIAIQPILIRQQTPTRSSRSNEIISFPFIMSSGVNNIDEMYNTSRGY